MVKTRGPLVFLLLVVFAMLAGCSSLQSTTTLETTGDRGFLTTAAQRAEAKQASLNSIFGSPLTRDATAAIKRTGITVQWTYPLWRNHLATNYSEGLCRKKPGKCDFFAMVGIVNSTTSYVVNLQIEILANGKYQVNPTHAYVLQTRKVSSSRTIVSAADLNNKTAVWVDANIGASGLKTASGNSSTVRLSASSPISGYSNLGKLLTVGGGNVAPSMCQASILTIQCGGGGGGSPTTPPAPEPESGPKEPKCDRNACDSERYDARTANWDMAGAILRTGAEVATAAAGCATITRFAPGAAKDACKIAIVAAGASVTNGVAKVRNANADKIKYQNCKSSHPCVSCLGRNGYFVDKRSSWQSILG